MRVSWVTVTLLGALLVGCGGQAASRPEPDAPSATASSDAPTASPSPTATAETSPVPPDWLGTRVLPLAANGFGEVRRTPPALRERAFTLPDTVDPLPGRGFASEVVDPAPRRVLDRSTWQPACPVAAGELAWVRLTFRGFDGERHTGELLLAGSVAGDVVGVFRELWRADFPIEEMRVTRADELDAPPTGDGNNTGAFVCRPVVGGSSYSQHAYGLAVDLNPFQNPYTRGAPPPVDPPDARPPVDPPNARPPVDPPDPGAPPPVDPPDSGDGGDGGDDSIVLPELASAYLDRERRRPGMYDADSVVVRAFDRIGWTWGGTWRTAQDRHHFSLTGG